MTDQPEFLSRSDGSTIAYHRLAGKPGEDPGVMFLGGFMSDMTGSKAQFLDRLCRAHGWPFLRFDYGGHGQSSGRFEEGSIGAWAADALAVFDAQTEGPQILIGSSMGGWMMLLLALARPERVAGLIGIASAPDFTEDLLWARFTAEQRACLTETGRLLDFRPASGTDPENPFPLTLHLIEEARQHLLLRAPIPLTCPVRLLHGMQDADVPWETSLRLAERLQSTDIDLTLIKEGDHRLSTEADLRRLVRTLAGLRESLL